MTLRKTDLISAIWDEMIRQNPKIQEKNLKPFMYLGKEPLDFDKRLINYDFENGSKAYVLLPPHLCCIKDFRSTPKKKSAPTTGESSELERKEQKSMDGMGKDDVSTV